MRVTLINRLAGIRTGGGEVYDISLAEALLRRGVGVELITGRRRRHPPQALPQALPVRYVTSPFLRDAASRLGRPGWRIEDLDLMLFERGVERLMSPLKPRPDLVQLTGLPRLALRIQSKLGLPTVLLFPGPPSPRHRAAIEACRTVVGVGAVTPYLRETFRRPVHDMTAGVDASIFRPGVASLRPALGLPGDAPVILFAGRLVPLKNIPGLVAAFRAIRAEREDARFLVAGDGPLRAELLAAAERSGIGGALHLAGERAHAEMPSIYASADLLLLASENESFSLAALEAMACGLPVVAPRVGYLPVLLEDGAGARLYPAGDTGACARLALDLLLDPEARRSAGDAARRRALERHSWDAVAAEFEALYAEALAS